MGTNEEEWKLFKAYSEKVMEYVVQSRTHQIAFPWDELTQKTLDYFQEKIVEFEGPADQYWPLWYYKQEKGDPARNGMNHKQVVCDGKHSWYFQDV